MPIQIKGKTTPDAQTPSTQTTESTESKSHYDNTGVTPPGWGQTNSHSPYLMSGSAQAQQVNQQEAMRELGRILASGAREFFLKTGEFANVLFLDGNLSSGEIFDTPMVAVHMAKFGQSWRKFMCNEKSEGNCIACAAGERVTTLQLFTVINTMPYTIQSGPRRGTVLQARLQLFAATMQARKDLVHIANKNGGRLSGLLIECRRNDDRDPRVGGHFSKENDLPLDKVVAKYPMLGTTKDANGKFVDAPTKPFDYATVYPALTNAQLAQLRPDWASYGGGFGASPYSGSAGGGQVLGQVSVDDDTIPF